MKTATQAQASNDTIVFERGYPPLAMFFLIVPALTVLLVIVNVALLKLPIPMIALLVSVAIVCIAWISIAAGEIGAIKIECTPEELRVSRLIGATSYSWSFIEEIKLADPGASMADGGRSEEGRVGIGLFLRSSKNKPGVDHSRPDAFIVSGSRDQVEKIMQLAERLNASHRKARAGARGQRGGGFNAQRKAFRKPQGAAATVS